MRHLHYIFFAQLVLILHAGQTFMRRISRIFWNQSKAMADDEKNICAKSERKARNREIYEQWMLIQEIVGDAKLWPYFIRKLFWTRGIKHDMRPILAAFVFVNGLDPIVSTVQYIWIFVYPRQADECDVTLKTYRNISGMQFDINSMTISALILMQCHKWYMYLTAIRSCRSLQRFSSTVHTSVFDRIFNAFLLL